MQIFVKLPKGESLQLSVEQQDSIEAIKKIIEQKTGIDAQQQQCSFGPTLLEDGHSLSDYKIQHESTIFLVRSRSGNAYFTF